MLFCGVEQNEYVCVEKPTRGFTVTAIAFAKENIKIDFYICIYYSHGVNNKYISHFM